MAKIGLQIRKVLIVEKSLVTLLDMNFTFSELEDMGIVRVVEWTDSTAGISSDLGEGTSTTFVYMVRSMSMETLPLLTQLGVHAKKSTVHVLFVPTISSLGMNRIRGILGENTPGLEIRSLPSFDSVSIEEDVISLQLEPEFFERTECESDPTSLGMVAKFLKRLEYEFGVGVGFVGRNERKFRKINAIGPGSKIVCDLFLSANETGGKGEESTGDIGSQSRMPSQDGAVVASIGRVGGLKTIGASLKNVMHAQENNKDDQVDCAEEDEPGINQCIDSVVIIDRRSDLWSLLCSEFTYEALIDENFGISNNRVKFKAGSGETTTMCLSSTTDPLFAEVRDVSVSVIGQLLSKKANYISECYKEKDALKSISEIKDFMDRFKVIQSQHSSLTNHVSLATECSEFARNPDHVYMLKIEDQIMSMSKPVGKILWKIEKLIRKACLPAGKGVITSSRILRLLCLASLVFGGKAITSAGVEKVLRSLVNKFGVKMIRTIFRLEQAGLLRYHNPASSNAGVVTELMSGGSKWPKIRDEFKVILDGSTETDMGVILAEPYSGFVPISVRLVQLLSTSWKTSADKLNLLRGPAIEIVQECPIATSGGSVPGNTIFVAVVFIGGVTYGEIAALRKLSQLEGGKRKFLIITTGISSSTRVIDSL
jgi:hypothetical protein